MTKMAIIDTLQWKLKVTLSNLYLNLKEANI